ncbi:unnamed protein product, partial [Amoebophrya sp. A25]|eukprot:GSA25T00027281001.1
MAFEPLRESFELIKASVSLNPGFDRRMMIFNAAVGSKSGSFTNIVTGRIGNRGNTRILHTTTTTVLFDIAEDHPPARQAQVEDLLDASGKDIVPDPEKEKSSNKSTNSKSFFNVSRVTSGVQEQSGGVVFFYDDEAEAEHERERVDRDENGHQQQQGQNSTSSQPSTTLLRQPLAIPENTVPEFALSDIVDLAGAVAANIGLVKIDSEGSEWDVLRGLDSRKHVCAGRFP